VNSIHGEEITSMNLIHGDHSIKTSLDYFIKREFVESELENTRKNIG
jgi:hypothetical protein